MNPKNIFVMRHAESEEDVDKTVYARMADLEVGLSPKGKEQAVDAGKIISNIIEGNRVHFYLSPGKRLRQTYEIINNTFPKTVASTFAVELLILKQFWGDVTVENRREIEIARYKEGVLIYRFPNGESGAELIDRFRTFVSHLRRDFQRDDYPENIVIMTHGFEMRVLLMVWFEWTASFFEKLANPLNCEIATLLLQKDGSYRLKEELRMYDPTNNPQHIQRIC